MELETWAQKKVGGDVRSCSFCLGAMRRSDSVDSLFEMTFHSAIPERDKFLSRVFGIFSEEIVRAWCRNPRSSYNDLGRPTLYPLGGGHYTLDFTFRSRQTGQLYVGELKCELEFQGYRYLRLVAVDQLNHLNKRAFRAFLRFARDQGSYNLKVAGKPKSAAGCILVWGSVDPKGAEAVKATTGIHDVLSLEQMIEDLVEWRDQAYLELVRARARWCEELFTALEMASPPHST